jgi:hypothetical protein
MLNSNNACARCSKVVYAAEKVAAAGHVIKYFIVFFNFNYCFSFI